MASQTIPASAGTKPASVKLVIWDLDETLWRGTLSETSTTLIEGRAELLTTLVDRGVMVSVCSKNDLGVARRRLEELGLWDLVVFPRIDWLPKGPEVQALIETAQLRPENVLFVDDNPLNRAEVAWQVPGIQVLDPAEPAFDGRMAEIVAAGKDDAKRSRLAEYKVLETKASAAETFGDNLEFLRSCDIRVQVTERPAADAERIQELLARTNQLNYTKRRASLEEVRTLLADPEVRSLAIRVTDRFGDYGLVGFGAVRRTGEGTAVEHLAFSCRILNMGIEQWVWHQLGAPAIEVAEPVSTPLGGPLPDWITKVEGAAPVAPASGVPSGRSSGNRSGEADPNRSRPGLPVLFVGGCDLEQSVAFVDADRPVTTYFNYTARANPKLTIHRDSIDFLLSDGLTPDQRAFVLETSPFLDPQAFELPDYGRFGHIVYSPLIDYVQAKYVSDSVPGFFNSFGDLLTPAIDELRIASIAARSGIDPERMRRFAAVWRPAEKQDDVYRSQLLELFGRMTRHAAVTVLLGATTTHGALDAARLATHQRLNAIVAEVATPFPGIEVIAVDPLISTEGDFAGSIRHYQRRVYFDLAKQISARIGADVRSSSSAWVRRGLARIARRLRRARPV
ncbi:MAG TPA: HAD-IIIC family phosphatase [Candidatus Limnocylindrales bacterium]|nr:HAD-IIIC family phosphatase [Candidatus Limnocylindrales bacterium]